MSTAVPPQPVFEEDWDYLIVLDALRYDVFAETYEEYFEGDLRKYESPGSATPEWAANTFTGHHDVTYLSAIPFVNSRGTPLKDVRWGSSCGYDWTAADHVAEVVDLWETEWDPRVGTVHPERVTAAARDRVANGHDGDRMIVHYLQPHTPFLGSGRGRKLSSIRDGVLNPPGEGADRDSLETLRKTLEARLSRVTVAQRLGLLYDLRLRGIRDVATNGFRETLLAYYRENVHTALSAAADLIEDLEGDVVVTADHGEGFGEQGVWAHHVGSTAPALLEVPWLRVD